MQKKKSHILRNYYYDNKFHNTFERHSNLLNNDSLKISANNEDLCTNYTYFFLKNVHLFKKKEICI